MNNDSETELPFASFPRAVTHSFSTRRRLVSLKWRALPAVRADVSLSKGNLLPLPFPPDPIALFFADFFFAPTHTREGTDETVLSTRGVTSRLRILRVDLHRSTQGQGWCLLQSA